MARPWNSALHGRTSITAGDVVFSSIIFYLHLINRVVLSYVAYVLIEYVEQMSSSSCASV